MIHSGRPAPARGANASSRSWGGMRWTRKSSHDGRRRMRTAKSCGPGAPWLAPSRRSNPQATVTKKSWTPGRARNTPEHHCAGKAGCRGVPVVTNSCGSSLPTRGYGCEQRTRFPCALLISRDMIFASLGRDRAAGMRSHTLPSCPAQAGHPVFRRRREQARPFWNAGSAGPATPRLRQGHGL